MAWTTPTLRATGDLITAAIWNADVVNNIKEIWHEVSYTEQATDVVVATSVTTVVTAAAFTTAAVPTLFEFKAPRVGDNGGNQFLIYLYEDGVQKGSVMGNPQAADTSVFEAVRLTPTAASHTYSIRAQSGFGTPTIYATGLSPVFLRISQKG